MIAATTANVVAGVTLIADSGFTCLAMGDRVVVYADGDGTLFVPCNSGGHAIAGPLDDGANYTGFSMENAS